MPRWGVAEARGRVCSDFGELWGHSSARRAGQASLGTSKVAATEKRSRGKDSSCPGVQQSRRFEGWRK